MELVELGELTDRQWSELAAGERHPWGGEAEELTWRDKDRLLGLQAAGGRLAAVARTVPIDVVVDGSETFAVVGLGGVFVTPSERGGGLVGRLVEPLLQQASCDAGVERAMLFCRAQLTGLYAKLAFSEIQMPVWAEQPGGRRIEMPMRAMWRPLRDGATWPAGRVEVLGLPF